MQLKFAVLVAALLSGVAATADQAPEKGRFLSLDEAIETALVHHPRLRTAQLEVAAAEARITQAGSTRFPEVDAGGIAKQGLSGSGNAFELRGLASSPLPDDMAVSANVYQDLLDFGRTTHQSAARRSELVYFIESTVVEKAEVVLEVKKAFYRTLQAQKLIEVAQETVKDRKLTLRQAEAFYRAQLRSKLDVRVAEVELSRAELGLVRASNSLQQSFAVLDHTLGVEAPEDGYALEEPDIEPAQPPSFENLLAEGLEGRPELRAVEARIKAAGSWVERAESERYPRLMGLFSGGWTRFADLTLGKLLFGGFGIKLPLFTGRRLEAVIEEARQNLGKAEAARDELIQKTRLQISRAYNDLVTAMETITTSEQIVSQAEEALRLARVRYQMELADFVELVAAQTVLTAAESEYAQALYDYKIAESELEYATGSSKQVASVQLGSD